MQDPLCIIKFTFQTRPQNIVTSVNRVKLLKVTDAGNVRFGVGISFCCLTGNLRPCS